MERATPERVDTDEGALGSMAFHGCIVCNKLMTGHKVSASTLHHGELVLSQLQATLWTQQLCSPVPFIQHAVALISELSLLSGSDIHSPCVSTPLPKRQTLVPTTASSPQKANHTSPTIAFQSEHLAMEAHKSSFDFGSPAPPLRRPRKHVWRPRNFAAFEAAPICSEYVRSRTPGHDKSWC